ncbi:hypothetical protein ABW19_dt0207747 [Dactylella cylindrospora]|nr:hypothetical protein ABW19_dt0207747 [Dactylella cylindrospora]
MTEPTPKEIPPPDTKMKSSVWYVPGESLVLSPYAQRLFQEYCGIPADEVATHIVGVRERAWKVYPYPCIGNFRFLDFAITESPGWPTVIETLHGGGKFLDLGCCFAQDVRALAHAGVPSENLYGADLKLDFIDLGYELFRDQDSLKSKFIEADIFDQSSALKDIDGQMDIVSARSFLHLFPEEEEFKAACRIVALLKDAKGSIIMGRQVGSKKPGLNEIRLEKRPVFRHDPETWKTFWDRVGDATSTNWDVQAHFIEVTPQQRAIMKNVELSGIENRAWLEFVITRV